MTSPENPAPAPAGWPRLNGELLATSLLAFLKNWNAYGYQLTQRITESGMPQCDSGTVYRTLRQLERSGLVSSFWDTSESGPARRMYSLTAAGELMLSTWIDALQHYQNVLQSAVEGFAPPAADPASAADTDGSTSGKTRRGGSK